MIGTVFAISAAYVVMAVLLLVMSLKSPFAWWVKAAAVIATTCFFIEIFFATRDLLSYPSPGKLPPRFQLLWARVVEPDAQSAGPGAIFLWVEEMDENNVPDGLPRAFRLPYERPLAEKTSTARDAIMAGNPQEGTAEELSADGRDAAETDATLPDQNPPPDPNAAANGSSNIDFNALTAPERVLFRPLPPPLLPPKLE